MFTNLPNLPLEALQTFLNEVTIPAIRKQPKTFLGIAKQPHYENVISNIYAFFFDVNEAHKMSDLFLISLLEILRDKRGKLTDTFDSFLDFRVSTEQSTKKGGRIDLLLACPTHAIIIENKVYHELNNDLEDYWESIIVDHSNDCNKLGIVLSLNPMHTNNQCFINITHLDLMSRVIQNLGTYLMNAQDKYVFYLKDFYQNIINISKSQMNTKELQFYYNNQQKIEDIRKFNFAVRTHIANEVDKVCNILEGNLKLVIPPQGSKNNKRLRYFQSAKNPNLMITVVFDGLLTSKQGIYLIVELKNNLLKDKTKYVAIPFTDEEKNLLKQEFYATPSNQTWAHFAVAFYNLNTSEVSDLGNYIAQKLEHDGLMSIFSKIEKLVESKI